MFALVLALSLSRELIFFVYIFSIFIDYLVADNGYKNILNTYMIDFDF